MRKIILLTLLVAAPLCWGQAEARPEILVLGTYHMANHNRDIYNIQADDDLSPKRQQEIAEVIEVLKRFRPTKIAIEADVDSKAITSNYTGYLAGKYTLSRDETDQIGFRLAKELGHKAVYPVNVVGEFPMQRVQDYAKAHGKGDKFEAMMAQAGAMVKEQDEYLRTHSVLETLEYMNSDAETAKAMAPYYACLRYGEPDDYAGAELMAMWYQRNIRIYSNIVALVDSPDDRILVIYGAGHLGWFRQDAEGDSFVKLRKLAEFRGKQ